MISVATTEVFAGLQKLDRAQEILTPEALAFVEQLHVHRAELSPLELDRLIHERMRLAIVSANAESAIRAALTRFRC